MVLGRIVKMGLEDLAMTLSSQDDSWSSSSSSSIHHLWWMLLWHPQLTIFISSETIHILVTLTNSNGKGKGGIFLCVTNPVQAAGSSKYEPPGMEGI